MMSVKAKQFCLYLITFFLACCSLMYELLIAEAVASLATNTVIWYSVTIGLYLFSLGVGVMHCGRIFSNKEKVFGDLSRVEFWISFLGLFSVIFLSSAHLLMTFFWVRGGYGFGAVLFFAVAFFLIVGIGFLSGLELPLLILWGKQISPEKGCVNRILAFDYFGSLAAGLIFPLVFVPHLQLIQTSVLISAINLGIAFYLFYLDIRNDHLNQAQSGESRFLSWPQLLLLFLFAGFAMNQGSISQYFLKKYYYYPFVVQDAFSLFKGMKNFPEVEREISSYQRIDFVRLLTTIDDVLAENLMAAYRNSQGHGVSAWNHYALFINGSFQFYGLTEALYHEYFAHVPVILNGKVPKKVLVLGAGDGLLIRELVKYEDVQSVTMVEIDPKIIGMARNHPVIRKMNQAALEDTRIKVVIQDAYSFVRNCKESYDAVYMDFPEPSDYNLSKIYSVEFYESVSHLLSEDGFIVFDAPGVKTFAPMSGDVLEEEAAFYIQTLAAAGYAHILSYETELERDNPAAGKILREALSGATSLTVREKDIHQEKVSVLQGTENIIDKLLKDFVDDYKQRFIFAKKYAEMDDLGFIDFGIDLTMLNQARYDLAVDYNSQQSPLNLDKTQVNSILRPTLPNPRFWWRIKFPY